MVLILLTIFRFRELVINIIPDYLKNGIAAGIGIFITFIGFVQGGDGFWTILALWFNWET